MPLRTCLGWNGQTCTRLTAKTRCPEHQRMYEAARRPNRPTARQRGYDTAHDKLRTQLLPLAIGKPCPRCGEVMTAAQELDLGHPDGQARSVVPGARAQRMEHRRCNQSAGNA